MRLHAIVVPIILACASRYSASAQMTGALSIEKRVDNLVSRMTVEEKVSQMTNDSAAIPRLGIPAYNWWNGDLHGVARLGYATLFPQAIGMASTWNTELIGACTLQYRANTPVNRAVGKRWEIFH